MNVEYIIDIHPERVKSIIEVDSILFKINEYEQATKRKGGVVLKQNRQLGGSYRIVSEEEAKRGLENPGKCEWYVEFYPRSYFEELRHQFSGNKKYH